MNEMTHFDSKLRDLIQENRDGGFNPYNLIRLGFGVAIIQLATGTRSTLQLLVLDTNYWHGNTRSNDLFYTQ